MKFEQCRSFVVILRNAAQRFYTWAKIYFYIFLNYAFAIVAILIYRSADNYIIITLICQSFINTSARPKRTNNKSTE